MTGLLQVLLAASILLSLGFVVALGRPSRHKDVSIAWLLAALGWSSVLLDVALLALTFGKDVPLWMFAILLVGQDAVFGWRLWLLLRARQHNREDEEMITAKVVCGRKTVTGEGGDREAALEFYADYADGRNQEWARYTPTLQLAMTVNGAVADRFEQGQHFTLTFEPEPAPKLHVPATPEQGAAPGAAP